MPSSMGPRGTTIGAVLNAHKNVQPVVTAADMLPITAVEWMRRMSSSGGMGVAPSKLPAAPVPPTDVLAWLQNMARAGGLGLPPSRLAQPQPIQHAGLGPQLFALKH